MKFTNICLLSIFIFMGTGCSGWLEEDDAPKLSYDFYETEEGVDAAITAAYTFLRWGANGGQQTLSESGTDLMVDGEDFTPREEFMKYGASLNSNVAVLYNFWENHYKGISDTNIAMEQLENSTSMTPAKIKQGMAEMLFIRSYLYFDMVQQFGKIPLITKGSLNIRTDFKRTPVADIYNQIISDLRTAVEDLPETTSTRGRATCYAAAHLLSKVYLTRSSAVGDVRGQKTTDIDSALYYAEKVIIDKRYTLQNNFADLWDINNQGNSEVIFAIQFTNNLLFNGNGNLFHLYFLSWYEDQPGMVRDIANGRPYRWLMASPKTRFELFDRKNDSRFYKSFKWVYYANRAASLPRWAALSYNGEAYFTPDPAKGQVTGELKFNLGDTAIYYSMEKTDLDANGMDMRKLRADYTYSYFPLEMHSNRYFPALVKYLDPIRTSVAETKGAREWVRMRLGETYLLAAEAAGRKGDLAKAAEYINVVRKRAAWADGEAKMSSHWEVEGGKYGDTNSTYEAIKVTEQDLQGDFVEFILDERGRELLGEMNRWEDLVRCEKLLDMATRFNPTAIYIKPYHKLRPIPQKHIDRLNPAGNIEEEQNEGYY